MDFDLGDLTSLIPTGSGGDGDEGHRGVPPPLGCVIISLVLLAGIAAGAWWMLRG